MFKLSLKLILIGAMLSTQTASAHSGSLRLKRFQGHMHRVFVQHPNYKTTVQPIAATSAAGKKILGHYGQTVLLIWILAGIETYRHMTKMQPVTEDQFDAKILGEIFDKLINDPELISGMLGAGASTTIMAKPLQELQILIQNSASRAIIKNLLISGAMSFVTFVGWEAGTQLWKEALYQLSPEDYENGKNLRFLNILGSLFTLQVNDSNFKLVMKVMWEATKILALTPIGAQRSRDWLYHTWRLRLATGEFLTLVTGMVGGGAVIGSVFPGLGNVVGGLIGGVGGGLATIFIPTEWKDGLTEQFRVQRFSHNQSWLDKYNRQIQGYGEYFKSVNDVGQTPEKMRVQAIDMILKHKKSVRDSAMTAAFEEIYHWKVKIQEADMLNTMLSSDFVKEHQRNLEAELKSMPVNTRKDVKKKASFLSQIEKRLLELKNLKEEAELILKEGPLKIQNAYTAVFELVDKEIKITEQTINAQNLYFPDQALKGLIAELARLSVLTDAIQLMAMGTLPGHFQFSFELYGDEMTENQRISGNFLNLAYARGFDEAWFY